MYSERGLSSRWQSPFFMGITLNSVRLSGFTLKLYTFYSFHLRLLPLIYPYSITRMSHIYPCFVTNICHYFDLLAFVYVIKSSILKINVKNFKKNVDN